MAVKDSVFVSLSTFYTLDKETAGQTPLAQRLKLACGGGIGCGHDGGCGRGHGGGLGSAARVAVDSMEADAEAVSLGVAAVAAAAVAAAAAAGSARYGHLYLRLR
jgi:hypothetical protein